MPTGYPELVEPKLEKLDLPHLRNDMRKYRGAGVLGESYDWWQTFLATIEDDYGSLPVTLPEWIMDRISTYLKDPPPRADPVIPDKISEYHANQMKPSQEVNYSYVRVISQYYN